MIQKGINGQAIAHSPLSTAPATRPLLDCKGVSGLEVMGSDRSRYPEWRTKFINALRSSRPLIYQDLKKVLDTLEKGDSVSYNDIGIATGWTDSEIKALSTEIYCVLVDKTTGGSRPNTNI